MTQRLFALPDKTLVYPAHDYRGQTVSAIAEEKQWSPQFVGRKPLCKYCWLWLLTEGLMVGILTGLVGVGGGFAIVLVLVLLAKLPMKQAIGQVFHSYCYRGGVTCPFVQGEATLLTAKPHIAQVRYALQARGVG